jgi:hypothetical protein
MWTLLAILYMIGYVVAFDLMKEEKNLWYIGRVIFALFSWMTVLTILTTPDDPEWTGPR